MVMNKHEKRKVIIWSIMLFIIVGFMIGYVIWAQQEANASNDLVLILRSAR